MPGYPPTACPKKVPTQVTTMHPGFFFSEKKKKQQNSEGAHKSSSFANTISRPARFLWSGHWELEPSSTFSGFVFSLGEIRRRVRSRRRHDSYEAKELRGLSGTAVMSLEDQTAKKPHTHGGSQRGYI